MAKDYEVVDVIERVIPTRGGRFKSTTRITYRLPSDYEGTVDIEGEKVEPEAAKAAIEADIKRVQALFEL